ncbi:hypothetical protein OU995_17895 [Roseateles sp. SL47]|uniref:hypothetical protein n=1 Tax=Roseateles sp. SL47 TaxID=2995138 RepID=UPI00226E7C98|nr:hypothetical protein [Roseateles sp. SL47]WAC71447.1 hypothetical protein OU995_17895 [Roseateles sp. SL47]
MAGLNAVTECLHAVVWEVKRQGRGLLRRVGLPGVATGALLLLAIGAVAVDRHALVSLEDSQRLLQRLPAERVQLQATAVRPEDEGRRRLAAFDQVLPAHDEIPQAVGDLLMLAENEGLLVEKGDYRLQLEPQGGFVRYRMTLPVKGDATAVRKFMLDALRSQRTLALESVQFKREAATSRVVEARIQWVLMAQATTARAPTRPATLQALAGGDPR